MISKCYLFYLPDEVLISIVVNLSLADVMSCMLSCRRLSFLISDSSLMQYLIRTMRHGVHDPLIPGMSIPERVKALEVWERAWLELNLGEPFQRLPLSAIGLDDSKKCMIRSGILIGTQFNHLYLSGGYCYLDPLSLLNKSRAITCVGIPNLVGDAHVQSWTYVPESDLMAIVYQMDRRTGPSKLQFYQFSTGSQHPSAAIHCLEFDQLSTARVTCVECCGDTIIVVIRDGQIGEERGDYIFFVDWRIGRIVQLRKAQLGTYGTLVTFLSSDAILLARRDTFTLELCSLNGIRGDGVPTLQTLSSLKLPSPLSGQEIAEIRLSQPSSLSGKNHPVYPNGSLGTFPFKSNPEDDILAFDVYFSDDHGRRIIFVTHRRTLLTLAQRSGAVSSPLVKEWEEWGPRVTHWMELDPLNDSMSLAGSRCVLIKYSHLRNHFVLDLRDFNPYRVRNNTNNTNNTNNNNNNNDNNDIKTGTAGTAAAAASAATNTITQAVLSAEACFEEDVVSELPFVSIRKENVGSRVFFDDQWMAEILWDQDTQTQFIHFRTVASPAELERPARR